MANIIVGCDVGGTFTDLIALSPATGEISYAKVPSTPDNQARGVLSALDKAGADAKEIALFIHGTTVTTNALLERKVARCGMITTKGFRDTLELGRRTRPHPYGLIGDFTPIIPRELRLEVRERMDAEGEVVTPLNEDDVVVAVNKLLEMGAESVVIHFMHSYANPDHERRTGEIVRKMWPNAYVTVGHEIVPEFREYERAVTVSVNAAIQPVLSRYIDRLSSGLKERGLKRDLLVMQGNGGTAPPNIVTHAPVHTVMSGPASGVIAAGYLAKAAGYPNVVTYDMGGTSTDVALVLNGKPIVSSEIELEYAMPLHVPMVDVHTVGAGGGSIGQVNEAGLLQVGPESAGAFPGPIAFGRGGKFVTITDANLLLGRLDINSLLAVNDAISLETLREAMRVQVADPLGIGIEEAAEAILRVANDKMAGAIRLVTLSRGQDPRDFCLIAFGGAGPLHANALAIELAIPTVLIPPRPGLTNALGCLIADLRHDFVRSVNRQLSKLDASLIADIFGEQVAEGRSLLAGDADVIDSIDILHKVDMQFEGQSHVLSVDIATGTADLAAIEAAFLVAYEARFHVNLPGMRAVLVNLHTSVIGKRPALPIESLIAHERAASVEGALIGSRQVWFGDGWKDTPIYNRDAIPLGAMLNGPAILNQLDTTVVIEPGQAARTDVCGNILIELLSAEQKDRGSSVLAKELAS